MIPFKIIFDESYLKIENGKIRIMELINSTISHLYFNTISEFKAYIVKLEQTGDDNIDEQRLDKFYYYYPILLQFFQQIKLMNT